MGEKALALNRGWDWSANSSLSYQEYMRLGPSTRAVCIEISEQTREIIASRAQFAASGYAISRSLSEGFERLEFKLDDVQAEVRLGAERIDSTLQQGFSALYAGLVRVEQRLEDLLDVAKSPARVGAAEWYQEAMRNFRDGLYPEALTHARYSITGDGHKRGVLTDHRPHVLVGTLLLGNYSKPDAELIDLPGAEAAFLAAARYAKAHHPVDAIRALTCASRAAFVRRNFEKAIIHAEAAVATFHARQNELREDLRWGEHMVGVDHASALLLLARSKCQLKQYNDAKTALELTYSLEPGLSKGGPPGEFDQPKGAEAYDAALRTARRRWKRRFNEIVRIHRNKIKQISGIKVAGFEPNEILDDELTKAWADTWRAIDVSVENNIHTYRELVIFLEKTVSGTDLLFEVFVERVSHILKANRRDAKRLGEAEYDGALQNGTAKTLAVTFLAWAILTMVLAVKTESNPSPISVMLAIPALIFYNIMYGHFKASAMERKLNAEKAAHSHNLQLERQLEAVKNLKWPKADVV